MKVALLSALCATSLAWRERKNTDKAVLFQTFPQLNTYDDACVVGTNHMLIKLFEYPYNQMTFYSAKYLNDLGSKKECGGTLNQWGEYLTVHLNVSQMPTTVWGGFCVPVECNQAGYDRLNQQIHGLISTLVNKNKSNSTMSLSI